VLVQFIVVSRGWCFLFFLGRELTTQLRLTYAGVWLM